MLSYRRAGAGRPRWATGALILMLAAAAAGVYTWQSLRGSCDVAAVDHASALLLKQLDRFDHAYQFTTSASPASLVRPVAELQQLHMDTRQVTVPACLETAKQELAGYMGAVIRAFLAYGAQEPDDSIRALLEQSDVHYGNFLTELEAVDRCAPFCLR